MLLRCHFNPRPPCGGRPYDLASFNNLADISIHAPRVGGDSNRALAASAVKISIHAPRVGGDVLCPLCLTGDEIISIHAPRVGGDVSGRPDISTFVTFQSTPPVWGATDPINRLPLSASISIHAPRVGGDRDVCCPAS